MKKSLLLQTALVAAAGLFPADAARPTTGELLKRYPLGAVVNDGAARIVALQNQMQEKLDRIQEITDEAGDDDFTDDQMEEIEALTGEVTALKKRTETLQNAAALTSGAKPGGGKGRQTTPDDKGGAGGKTKVGPNLTNKGTGGFKNIGEFGQCIRAATGPQGGVADRAAHDKLQNALTTYSSEGVGPDGGFAVPPDFRTEIVEKITGEESLLGRTDITNTGSNRIVVPKDETLPWDFSGPGIQVYWESEAGLKTQSKIALEQNTLNLNKLICLAPVTDELLEDAPGLSSYLGRKVPIKLTAKLNTAIVSGTGVGQPLGILTNTGSLVTVTKETSQPADTVYAANIAKMWAAVYGPWRAGAEWWVNPAVEGLLPMMAFDPAATSKVPVYLPANSLAGSPYSTLFGRPVIPVQAMPALGDVGDIMLVNPQQYWSAIKSPEVRNDISIHLFFDYDVTAFRYVMRVGGQPWWRSTIAPQYGSQSQGYAAVIEAR